MIDVSLRPARPDDVPFVVDSWARSFSRLAQPPRGVARWVWHQIHRAGILKLLEKSTVAVAYHEDLPGEIIGWICFAPPGKHPLSLHYVFVKRPARRNGVASQLIAHAIASADNRAPRSTHTTEMSRFLSINASPAKN